MTAETKGSKEKSFTVVGSEFQAESETANSKALSCVNTTLHLVTGQHHHLKTTNAKFTALQCHMIYRPCGFLCSIS